MKYVVELRMVDPQPVAGIRVMSHPEDIGAVLSDLLNEVMDFLDTRGVKPTGPPYNRYFATQMGAVEFEAGFPIPEPISGEGRVIGTDLPGGQVVHTVHFGPYNQLREAYRALGLWLKERNWNTIGPPWENYIIGPGDDKDPAHWRTEIYWPVESAPSR